MTLWQVALLAPILLPQLVWVRVRAARLPEAAGARAGQAGSGPGLRVLILGDSSAAGVGAQTQAQALSGRLVEDLARDHGVDWQVVARSGAVVPDALEMLEQVEGRFDAAVICLGVNDAKNGRRLADFERDYTALLRVLSERYGVACFVCSGLPRMRFFPILPRPLRDVLGARAARFDRAIAEVSEAHPGARHLAMDFTDDVSLMASDGFHPGPEIYAMWAERAAGLIRGR